jgi:AraC-like DNA-binding protein
MSFALNSFLSLSISIGAIIGKSFAAWLKERRLEKAKELLLTTNKIIYEIALDCGYRDVSAFVRAFRNRYGHTPNVFRKK